VTCPYILDGPDTGEVILLDGRIWCMGHIALGMSARRRRCPEDCPVDFGDCVRNQFDETGFRQYLSNLNYAGERQVLRYAKRCFESGAKSPEDVNGVFLGLAAGTRSKYRNALSRYHDYLQSRKATS
jgi:hypothetical protein